MKTLMLTLLALSFSAFAGPITLPGEEHHVLNDIRELRLTKEGLFRSMDRTSLTVGDSICANRAHVWSYDFKARHDINAAKLFLFYTEKTGVGTDKTWWYHVAPMINEGGKLWVMDAGFRGIRSPMTPMGWLSHFAKSRRCREILNTDTELLEHIFKRRVFPKTTRHGTYDCYYRAMPAPFRFPSTVAGHILGYDANRRPVRNERLDFVRDEVFNACVEVRTTETGRTLGQGRVECQNWMNGL